MLGTLKGAVLMCTAAIIPFAAATVAWAPGAQATASASAVCSGGKQVASAPLKANGSTWGTIHLCYNSSSAQAWGVVTSGMPACWASHDVYGCGGATVEHRGGTGAKNCNIARHAKTCATGRIPDGPSTPSNASAQLCILPAAPFACEQWAGGQTTNYP